MDDIPNSSATIGRLIKRNNYFFAGKEAVKGKRVKKQGKQRVKGYLKVSDTKPGYIQVDGAKFYYIERNYYFLTAGGIVSKQA